MELKDFEMEIKETWIAYIQDLQNRICVAVEEADSKARFIEDKWERAEGGGGLTRVIADGDVFEKGGVNTSVVFGDVTDAMRNQLKIDGDKWWACGLSVVLHPINPFVPTVHCNYRMFELYENNIESVSVQGASMPPLSSFAGEGQGVRLADRWFGGGTDLTPYYLFEEDAQHFHETYKNVCDGFDLLFYPLFKKQCDDYFVNTHRGNERRGIGGIFYDYLRATDERTAEDLMSFGKACGDAFLRSYVPIVEKQKNTSYSKEHKHWQEIRRGRYVEFNLVHDRGTLFGLKTNGRTESILMSLPPTVRFEYDYQPKPGSEEDKLVQVCLQPQDWV